MKIKSCLWIWAGLLLAVLPGKSSAFAADFNLSVPYEIKNIQSDTQKFTIYCWVYGQAPTGGGGVPQIGFKAVQLNINGKSQLVGTAKVGVNASSGKNPNDAASYKCELRAFTTANSSSPAILENHTSGPIKGHHLDGTKSNDTRVSGVIPKGKPVKRRGRNLQLQHNDRRRR